MSKSHSNRKGPFGWLGDTLENRYTWVIIATLLTTALLLAIMSAAPPTAWANDNTTQNNLIQFDEHTPQHKSDSEHHLWGTLVDLDSAIQDKKEIGIVIVIVAVIISILLSIMIHSTILKFVNVQGNRKGFYGWLGDTIEHRYPWIIIGTLVITALLFIPLYAMTPTERASDNPTESDFVKLDKHIQDTFPTAVYDMWFIVEAKDGDMLTQKNLYELLLREQALKDSNLSPFLYDQYAKAASTIEVGIYSIVDNIDYALKATSSGAVDLSNASDAQIKQTVDMLLNDPTTEYLEEELSIKATHGEDGWTSPAIVIGVRADEEKVKNDYLSSVGQNYSGDIALEYFARDVQQLLRENEPSYWLWGIAIDLELEIQDESKISIIMIMIALVLISILLIMIFHSALIMFVTVLGLGMLIVWLRGFSNLIGLNSSMILDLIVPISIIVLGVDYAIHAIFRYREETDKGKAPQKALGDSTHLVSTALVLAMGTTAIAFLSNASSGIESVVGFAIATSFAIVAALIILGLFVPSVVMRWQARHEKADSNKAPKASKVSSAKGHSRGIQVGKVVSWVSDRWFITLPIVLIVTGFAAWGWMNVETRMDAEDALYSRSDFVVSLDKLDEHVAEKSGELTTLYIEGDLTQHEALDAMKATIDRMNDNEHVSRNMLTGEPNPYTYLFDLFEAVYEEEYGRAQIETASGVAITDIDGDLIPDTQEQLQAIYDYVAENGLPHDATTMRYTAERIEEFFVQSTPESGNDATLMYIGVPGTREQEVVRESARELKEDEDSAMANVDSIDSYGITGPGYVRVAQFDAIADSLNSSLIIAAAAVFVLLVAVFRSLRYAIITMVPVLLVACWLYGFMYIAGYYLNMMTATIAAISIGVGIDFSIHFTERFRQELQKYRNKRNALRETGRTTGFALFSTALTTAGGFMVIAVAPMPLFAAFGLLTAIMIALSLLMALLVLPSLLLVFIPEPSKAKKGGKAR